MALFVLVLMVLACVFLIMAAFAAPGVGPTGRPVWGWLGMFCWALATTVPMVAAL